MNTPKAGQIWSKGNKLHYLLLKDIDSSAPHPYQLRDDSRWHVYCIETCSTHQVWMNPNIDVLVQEG